MKLKRLCLAGHVAQNWSTTWPSLLEMYKKLQELGIDYEEDFATRSKASKTMAK